MSASDLRTRLDAVPRIRFCQLPTPLHPLTRLSEHLGGPELWIKRDDMTGFGMGGNKSRKLEFLMGAAMVEPATDIITCGAQQSNHARQTAAAAAACGLPCKLLLTGGPPSGTGNQTLFDWLGAEVEYLGAISWGDLRRASEALRDRLTAEGRKPYLIPVGGSTPLGALGYVNAAIELLEQGESFDRVYHASSSLSTQAGMVAGLKLAGSKMRVTGVLVDLTRPPEPYLATMANGICELLGLPERFLEGDFHCDATHIGEGYAIPSEEGIEAIRLLARTEGVFLDPVYSGKAFAGLLADIRQGKVGRSEKVLFWHTGGSPVLFAQEYAGLARCHNLGVQ
ncbi:MAG: D-cysteine desulfhydrase family protein [Fimbriimonadia bacterium]|jgi:L-cysteate sulfo-lyase